MTIEQYKMQSSIGPLFLVASSEGLQGIFWQPRAFETTKKPVNTFILHAVEELEEYLSGKRREFTVKLDIVGSDFQKKVWAQLCHIPYGETRSYKEVAILLNYKNASRAVGTANGRNPLSLIVPCHRVIASNGTLGGYAGGLEIKTKLLNLERKLCHDESGLSYF